MSAPADVTSLVGVLEREMVFSRFAHDCSVHSLSTQRPFRRVGGPTPIAPERELIEFTSYGNDEIQEASGQLGVAAVRRSLERKIHLENATTLRSSYVDLP